MIWAFRLKQFVAQVVVALGSLFLASAAALAQIDEPDVPSRARLWLAPEASDRRVAVEPVGADGS